MYAGRERPTGGFELFAWFFMRISGIVLVLLVLGHLAIMHVIHTVDEIDFDFVARRWASPFWRTYDLVMLWLALLHGLNGLRTVIDDYVRRRGWRVVALTALALVGFVLLAMGTQIIFTFEATTSRAAAELP
ncbi:MAG: succinate dehydrogenase, hydrophobic membrane anchor protein [Blastocatellia bacterium]|nr:succinate dehydrogenase, hydrophobic membrane anchor protein [Blastocatellia bacterium]MCS7156749.1 succinate dehydrogenase, hydrophobic membrane anchor protein [Blastocatellia bacterium]MCX7751509.1 succinate dehydrogenase, hydrophobic membrane anchor protein [Blastocatellia bacterium]MDW8168609.1 succinate dehydrogenase, hydrophobic membrane anchor protein [Acidobacteriota bacterium]MDW8256574.1 succinate dehydrogenase, hydrophobic membrane anchor protein [Acidobacteriota bacterium]